MFTDLSPILFFTWSVYVMYESFCYLKLTETVSEVKSTVRLPGQTFQFEEIKSPLHNNSLW